MQCFQSFITFRGAAFIKTNIATFFYDSALEWYTLELSDFDQNAWNNDFGIKCWIKTFSHHFKVLTSVALYLLMDKTYTFDNVWA